MRTLEAGVCWTSMTRRRHSPRGFTLIELMLVVAVVAILAAIAIPVFTSTSRKAKGESEVNAYFQDFRTRLEQYHQENGVYPATIGEGTFHPATQTAQRRTIFPLPATWTALRLRPSSSTDVYCGYTWVTGLAASSTNVGPIATSSFGFTAPATK